MPNPLDGVASHPSRDAFFQGVAERYQKLLDQDLALIEQFPLNFVVKQQVHVTLVNARNLQRYCELMSRPVPPFDVADALLVFLGFEQLAPLARFWGYEGPHEVTGMLKWLENLFVIQRERLRLQIPPDAAAPSGTIQEN